MSKAILVIDNMPESCDKCNFCRLYNNCYYCMATYKIIVDVDRKSYSCPMKQMMERKTVGNLIDEVKKIDSNDNAYKMFYAMMAAERVTGWNNCIDKILGGGGKQKTN